MSETTPTKTTEAKRTAIVLEADIQDRVAKLARVHKLTQGQVIQTMLDMLTDSPEFEAKLKSKREEKVGSRQGKTAILKKLSKLSAEELEVLAKALEGKQ